MNREKKKYEKEYLKWAKNMGFDSIMITDSTKECYSKAVSLCPRNTDTLDRDSDILEDLDSFKIYKIEDILNKKRKYLTGEWIFDKCEEKDAPEKIVNDGVTYASYEVTVGRRIVIKCCLGCLLAYGIVKVCKYVKNM